MKNPYLSLVVPAFNASKTIRKTLSSIFEPDRNFSIEVIVVDDGSEDTIQLHSVLADFPQIKLQTHSKNRGMCAARNTGIASSQGEFLSILDSDDRFVSDWPIRFEKIVKHWPTELMVCFSECVNSQGEPTVSRPGVMGRLSLRHYLNDEFSGEYLPIFKGEYVRQKPYVDIGLKRSCGTLSYVRYLQDTDFFISNEVLRIYEDEQPGSVSQDWFKVSKSQERAVCTRKIIEDLGSLYQEFAPSKYGSKLTRLAVYSKFGGLPGAWTYWWRAFRWCSVKEWIGCFVLLLMGSRAAELVVRQARKLKLLKRYG